MFLFFYIHVIVMIYWLFQIILPLIVLGEDKIKIFNFLAISVRGIFDIFGNLYNRKNKKGE